MTATTTEAKDRWVVCDDYARGPFTARYATLVAARQLDDCRHDHRVVVSAAKPVTVAELRTLYAEWDAPFAGDPFDDAAMAERGAQTRELAAAILAVPVGTRLGDMTVVHAGWTPETGAKADAVAEPGSEAWKATLGAHEDATLTSDGRDAIRDAWCDEPAPGDWVRYTGWTAAGQVAHGLICSGCRRLLQVG